MAKKLRTYDDIEGTTDVTKTNFGNNFGISILLESKFLKKSKEDRYEVGILHKGQLSPSSYLPFDNHYRNVTLDKVEELIKDVQLLVKN